jgi:hypothetical protein
MLRNLSLCFIFLFATVSFAQKELRASKCTAEKITIDGLSNEIAWNSAETATDFIQFKPSPGTPSSKKTEVQLLYDDQALYLFVKCFDNPTKMSHVLSLRDDFNANIDNFQFILDTYDDNLNGFIFGVSSKGVQYDAKITGNARNAELELVWSSTVKHTPDGWQAEIRIPYSAIRFPKKDIQQWGINFYRYISETREESSWNPIQPDFDNLPAQCGKAIGIDGIQPPLRLAFIPYLSSYAERPPSALSKPDWRGSFNGGMDIKWGLNEAFTLDLTLVPDFGQVVFDNQVLNLSPFEIQFNENRQFFTEGTEIFSKAGLFYSRRIGIQAPSGIAYTQIKPYEVLQQATEPPQLLNATKLSGRTKKGLGIGVFNALTAEQQSTALDLLTGQERSVIVSPFSNYNVLVLDQNLKNNSSITFTNTNVMREGNFYDANVSGLNFKFNSEDNRYFLSGRSALSNQFSEKINTGYNAGLRLGKQTGNFIYNAGYFEESTTYNPNDLGFNANNNKRILDATIGYRRFKPFGIFNQLFSSLSLSYNRLYDPDTYTATYLNGNIGLISRKFHANGIEFNSSLTESFDYFEPRTSGRYFVRPTWFNIGYWTSTNYQKRFAIDASVNYVFIGQENWKEYIFGLSPRIRISNRIFLIYEFEQHFNLNGLGYAVPFGIPFNSVQGIIFGKRDRINTTNSINLRLILTNRMGITFRLRHYRSAVSYDQFYLLNDEGRLTETDFQGTDINGNSAYNANYNAFTIDLVYRWVFLPGSELNIVWKNAIFSTNKSVALDYFSNTSDLFENDALNSFSLRFVYWLDYESLRKKSKRN